MSEMNNLDNKNENKSYESTNKLMLIFRLIAAGYVLYLSYTLVESYIKGDGMPLPGLICFVAVFVLISGFIIYTSVKALIKGEYAGGKADIRSDDNENEEEKNSVEDKAEDKGIARNAALLSERLQKYNEQESDEE